MIKFAWNTAKSRRNLEKHGVSFEEAQSTFQDDAAIQFFDDTRDEDRFILIGLSNLSRILVVVHCVTVDAARGEFEALEKAETIRIISARKATKSERGFYINYCDGESR